MKLPTIRKEYKNLAVACALDGEDFPSFLPRQCERELLEREQRAAERRLKAAQFTVLRLWLPSTLGRSPRQTGRSSWT